MCRPNTQDGFDVTAIPWADGSTVVFCVVQKEGAGPDTILREKLLFETKLSLGAEDGVQSQDRELEFNLQPSQSMYSFWMQL